jgi:hypothetical protein
MSQSKIEINVGGVLFSGEGEQAWLAEQLDKVLKAAPEITRAQPRDPAAPPPAEGNRFGSDNFATTLASYIREKGGDDNQVDRFLITADWLRRRGTSKLTTAAVSKAIRDNQQKSLVNPADCLNKNVSKGFCEKADGGFYMTPDGLAKLGH